MSTAPGDRVPLCADCGYARAGLETNHPCPECGHTPALDSVVLWGSSDIDTTAPLPARVATLVIFLGLTMAATAVWIACGSATGALFALLLFSAVALWTERVDDPRAGGPMQLRLAPGGFATRRGFGPVHWKPWCPRWRLRLVAGPFHRPTLLVTRPLLGPFAIDHPLRFSLNVPVHEAHDLATRVRQWLAKERA